VVLAVHFINDKEQPDSELFLQILLYIPFIYFTLLVGEENYVWGEGEWRKLVDLQ